MSYNAERRGILAWGLKVARKNATFSASAAAAAIAAAGIPCSRGTLLAWERGDGYTSREPFGSDLPIIAAIYGCSIADFFTQPKPDIADAELPVRAWLSAK